MSNNTEIAAVETEFRLPDAVDSADFSHEDLAEDMAGLQLRFQRVKIPGSGALQFEIPSDDPDNPDYTKFIQGVILHSHNACAYWANGEYDEDNAPPDCSSNDGIMGVGDPGGSCKVCAFNQYGTAVNGKGKACKNMRHLYILQDGNFMPILLTLPPTSLRPYTDFYNAAFAMRFRASCGSLVQIGLKRMSNGKDDYSVATFRRVKDFSGDQLRTIKDYANNFRTQLKGMQQEQTESEPDAAAAPAESYAADDFPVSEPGADEEDMPFFPGAPKPDTSFSIGSADVIDGDRMDLPA